jgi:hydrogenase-4 component B
MDKLGGLSRLMPWTALSFLVGGVAISALPPLNGFTSEFVIYSGLFTGEPIAAWAKAALGAGGAVLAFVGAVSALSITRAFGVVFLGGPRDASVHPPTEVSRWMLLPMGAHAVGVIVLGVLPGLGFMLVRGPAALALAGLPTTGADVLHPVADSLARIGVISGTLALVVAAVVWLRARALRRATTPKPASVGTWGCAYGTPNARMQYTGSSFSSDFSARFSSVMVMLKRQKAPLGYFPEDSYLITDCVDAVERRLFSVIKHGDASAADLSSKLREDDPRIAFAAALVAIVVMAGLIVLASGPLP